MKRRIKWMLVELSSGVQLRFERNDPIEVTKLKDVDGAPLYRMQDTLGETYLLSPTSSHTRTEMQVSSEEQVVDSRFMQGHLHRSRWNTEQSKLRVFVAKLPSGRNYYTILPCTKDGITREMVEDFGRFFMSYVDGHPEQILTPQLRARARARLRQRFPMLNNQEEGRLLEAVWRVLQRVAAWRDDLTPDGRRRYLETAVWTELNDQLDLDEPKRHSQTETLPVDLADSRETPLERVLRLEQEASDNRYRDLDRLCARAKLSDIETRLISVIRRGSTPSEAVDRLKIPKSTYINAYQKLKRAAHH